MPIRGLRADAYQKGIAAFDNDFSNSKWMNFIPEGHVKLENVLFAPLNIEGKVVGLLGLANKPVGFNDRDIHLAEAFGDLAALSLNNSNTLESLANSEERYRSLTQSALDAIIIADNKENIIFWNRGGEIIFWYSENEIIGKPLTILMPEKLREAHSTSVKRFLSTGERHLIGKTVEVTGVRKNGSRFPAELSLSSWRSKEEVFFPGILRDISDRKKDEEKLILLNTSINQAFISVVITNKDGIIQYVNSGFESITGYTKEEAIGCNPRILKSGKHTKYFYEGLWGTILNGDNWHGELINKGKNGEVYYEECTITPVETNNVIMHFVAIKKDVTERKKLEESIKRLRREYEIFMRHEIKNLLSPIKGYTDLLLMVAGDDRQKKFSTKISESIKSAVNLIDSLKKLQDIEAGNYELHKVDYSLQKLIESVMFSLNLLAEEHNVEIKYDCRVSHSDIQMEVELMKGVFLNLIKNAIEHVSDRKEEKEKVVKIDMVMENNKIIVRINNKGEPLSSIKLELFFEKFNSDRIKKKDGTGLGTTYAYLVTKAHGGDIFVESNEKEGTTVTVTFNV